MEKLIESNQNSLNKASCEKRLTYTIPEVSSILNISLSQTYKLASMQAIPTIRLGKRILVSVKKLEEFVNQ